MKNKIITIVLSTLLLTSLIGCKSDKENKDEEVTKPSNIGINLAAVKDYSTEYVFKDIFKMAREWRTESSKDVVYITDENGWIKDLNGNNHAVAFLANSYLPLGEYVITYDGIGDLSFIGPKVTQISKEEGRIEFSIDSYSTTSTANNRVKISSIDNNDYIRNIKIFEKQYEDSLDDIFNPVFLKNISMYNEFRFMDWMQTNNSTISNWEDRPKVNDYTYSIKGVPLEIMVELCNKVKANPWFCMPHSATDEYMIEFAKYLKTNLDKNLEVYIENSNEAWNGMFKAQSHNLDKGKEHTNISNSDPNWKISAHYYAQRSVEMFNIFEENFGSKKLIKVLASQSSNYGVGTTICKYELEDGSLAADYADVLAIAPYIGHSTKTGIDFTNQDAIFNHLDEEITIDLVKDLNGNKATADKYNLRLISYEGGQHLVDSSNNDKTNAFLEANKSERMGEIYTKYLDTYKSILDDKLFLFSSTGLYDKYGSWGLLEHQNQDINESYKYISVKKWIINNPINK